MSEQQTQKFCFCFLSKRSIFLVQENKRLFLCFYVWAIFYFRRKSETASMVPLAPLTPNCTSTQAAHTPNTGAPKLHKSTTPRNDASTTPQRQTSPTGTPNTGAPTRVDSIRPQFDRNSTSMPKLSTPLIRISAPCHLRWHRGFLTPRRFRNPV